MAEKGLRKWIVTLTVISASLLELIDTTIVNVSLPDIMGNLGATLEDAGWIVTGYGVANVIVLPMSGWLGNRFGRKNYFLASIIIFTVTSFFCGHATSLAELVVFRIIQGLAGGGLLSTAQAILLETWPKEEIGMATALFGLGAIIGPAVGPTLGGYINDHFSWPWIFYVNIPVGAIASFFVLTFVKSSPKEDGKMPVDWLGIGLLALAVGSLQTVLEKGESEDWFQTTYISVLVFTAVAAGICFLWRELSTSHPVVNLRIIKKRSFAIGMVTSFVLGLGLYGSMFAFPVLCQNILGFTAEQTGLILLPSSIATAFMMPWIGSLLKRGVHAQFISTAGMLLFFVFCLMMNSATTQSGTENFFWPLIIRGVGMSMLFVPLTTLAIRDLNGKEIGQGTGLNNMMRQLGGSFGIAIITTVLHVRSGYHRAMLIENINEYNPAFTERYQGMMHNFQAQGFSFDKAQQMAYAAMEGTIGKQAALMSYTDIFWMVGVFFLLVIPLLYLQKFQRNGVVPVDAH
jgi:DHA2 family multidrug resistance protein